MPSPTVVYLTSGSSWTVPSDWNSSANTIECIGAGGSGASPGSGGNGGSYAIKSNLSLSGTLNIGIGAGGASVISAVGNAGGNTWLGGGSFATCTVGGAGGTAGVSSGSSPSANGASVGTITYAGGIGGSSNLGGGGGAAGPYGAGSTGGGNDGGFDGGGGGGNGGGSSRAGGVGTGTTSYTGGAGGASTNGTAGGAGGVRGSTAAGVGSQGSGGGGGAYGGGPGIAGAAGGAGAEYDTSHGSGGGGGGGEGSANHAAGNGGLYGGGGGGSNAVSGAGANGIIVITYTPAATIVSSTVNVVAESSGVLLSTRTLIAEAIELVRRAYGAGSQTRIFRRTNRSVSAWVGAGVHRRYIFFTGTGGAAVPLEWGLSAGGRTLSADGFARFEFVTAVRGDRPAAVESSVGAAANFRAPTEAASAQRSDTSVGREAVHSSVRDSNAPLENLGAAATLSQDSFVPVESIVRRQGDASTAGEVSSSTGTAASTRAEWLRALRADPALQVEILSGTRSDQSAAFENSGALIIVGDSVVRLESLTGVFRHALAPLDASVRLTADLRTLLEWSSAASRDSSSFIENVARLLRLGAGCDLEFQTASSSNLIADAGAAIEIRARAAADAPARLESLGQTVVAFDIVAALENLAALRRAAAPLIEASGALALDTRFPTELSSLLARDFRSGAESAGMLLRGDTIADLETLIKAAGDVWVALESGFLIPAPLLSVERGRILATPGRLRILKVY
jgi:hypothetical protein